MSRMNEIAVLSESCTLVVHGICRPNLQIEIDAVFKGPQTMKGTTIVVLPCKLLSIGRAAIFGLTEAAGQISVSEMIV